MTWFKVDDSLHSNSKVRKVAARCPAALALWVIAGSFSADKLTEGFVRDDELPWLLPGAETLAAELVAARLWRRVKGGYQFHDWTQCNPTREQVEADRAKARDRMRRLRSGEQRDSSREVRANNGRTSRPRPVVPNGTTGGVRASPGSCPRHPGWPVDNCGGCRSEELSPP
jgi:hypothetical protein